MAPCESEISPSWSGWGRAVSLAQFLLGAGVGSMPSPQEAPCPPTPAGSLYASTADKARACHRG